MGDALYPIDLQSLGVRQVTAGRGHTCVVLEDDSTRCWGLNDAGQLGVGSTVNVGTTQGQMGAALVPVELFRVVPGAELEDLRLVGGDRVGWLQLQYLGKPREKY